jgi:hypothetical protein
MITFRSASGHPLAYDPDRSPVGYLPAFFNEDDPRSAKEQINENYQHGGGWRCFSDPAFTMSKDHTSLAYPDDPPMRLIAMAKLRNEKLFFYEGSWLAIVQPDGSHEIARVD